MRPISLISRFLLVALVTLSAGCAMFMEYGKLEKSAREDYLAGNYDSAVFKVVSSLRLDM